MTTKTTTKTIRIDNDVADWLNGKDARLILESSCELIRAGKLRLDDNGVHTFKENVHTDRISDTAMKCAKEVNQILTFYEADEDVFWADLLDKVTNGDMSSGKLQLDGGVLFTASTKESVAPILANLERLCLDRGVNLEEAYEKVLSTGAKIVYTDIKNAKLG